MTTNETRYDFSECRGVPGHAFAAIERASVAHFTSGPTNTGPTVLLFTGPPGTGKTMIARRIASMLDLAAPLDEHARTWIRAEFVGLGMHTGAITERPFRAPHHTISDAALVGESRSFSKAKGNPCGICAKVEAKGDKPDPFHQFHTLPGAVVPRAGELELARFGVLFLDELHEFRTSALQALGHALRAMSPRTRPMIVASTCPCPCGWYGVAPGPHTRECACTTSAVQRYTARTLAALAAFGNGATIAKVDMPPVSLADMRGATPGPSSADIAARVKAAAS